MHGVMADLATNAARHAGEAKIDFPGVRTLRFGEIDELAGQCANGLASLGIARGDHFLLHLPNSWEACPRCTIKCWRTRRWHRRISPR